MSDQLTKAEWVKHGLRTLAEHGPNGLKVGAMAQALGVSRGSFYWHFKDIADFKAQVLRGWADSTTEDVREAVETDAGEADRLHHLMKRVFGDSRRLDRAIRAWASSEPDVAGIVAAVDTRRTEIIMEMILAAGVSRPTAALRAAFLYWGLLGQTFAMDEQQADLARDGMPDIADLFRS